MKLDKAKRIAKQLSREFAIPFSVALLWMVYNLAAPTNGTGEKIRKAVNVVGPAFFFVSWLFSQYFRVAKQQKTDDTLELINKRIAENLDVLRDETSNVINYVTGGDSFCYLVFIQDNGLGMLPVAIVHSGKYPLHDVKVRIVDVDKLQSQPVTLESMQRNEIRFEISSMPSTSATLTPHRVNLETPYGTKFNVFFSARNGMFQQSIRYKWVNGRRPLATQVTRDGVVLYEHVDADYPLDADGAVDWS